jgi:hypothetical protein
MTTPTSKPKARRKSTKKTERSTVRISTQKGLISKAREVLGEAGSALSDSELLNYALIRFIDSRAPEPAPVVQMVPQAAPAAIAQTPIYQPMPESVVEGDDLSDDDWGVD